MTPRLASALGVRPDDPSISGELHDPFAPDLRHPDISWFFDPPEWFDDSVKIWVDSDGRAAGWYYHADTCIIDGNEGECWSPSPSPTGNELFHQGSVIAMDGDTPTIVEIGVIGGGGEHAPVWMTAEAAADYYADVTKQLLIGRIYDDPNRGGFFLGCVLPQVSNAQVDMVRRSALSGDWRWRRANLAGHALNSYDAIGPWLVTRPGLPLHRMGHTVMRLASAGSDHPVIVSAICGPIDVGPGDRRSVGKDDYSDEMPYHLETRGDHFAVVESRTGAFEMFDSLDEANATLAERCRPVAAAAAEPETNQGAEMTPPATAPETAAPPPPAPDAATPPDAPSGPADTGATAQDAEQDARLDALEGRVSDLEALVAEMMTADLQVDDIMPAEQLPGA